MYVDKNPYECNCVIQDFIDWSLGSELMRALYQKMGSALPVCESPPSMKGNVLYQLKAEETKLSCTDPVIFPKIAKKIVKKDKSLNLRCSASGVPAPDIRWVGPTEEEKGADQSELYIPNMIDEDFGPYTCYATNIQGTDSMEVLVIKDEGSLYDEHVQNYDNDDNDDDDGNEYDHLDINTDYNSDKDDEGYLDPYDEDDEDCPDDCFCDNKFVDCRDAELTSIPGKYPIVPIVRWY